MSAHVLTVIALVLGLACYVAGMGGLGLLLFFAGAAIEVAVWLDAVQPSRRVSSRLLARINPRR